MAFLLSIAAGIVFLAKCFRATPAERREYSLAPIAAALAISGALDFMADGGALPRVPEAWTPMYAFVPVALACGLTRRKIASHSIADASRLAA